MVQRLPLEEAKSFWFENDLVIYLTLIDANIYALPKIEVERALKYCELLEMCKTYNDVQALYLNFTADSDRPRLVPKLIDLHSALETLEEMWIEEEEEGIRDYGELSDEELIDYWLPKSFDLWERHKPSIYMEEEVLNLVRDFQVWTDQWMPIEVAQSLGVADEGCGIDYVNAEFHYQDLANFTEIFEKSGIEIKVDNPAFLKLFEYI
jgi:hypothetical protein